MNQNKRIMNYEVGNKYIMNVAGIRKDSAGYDYISLFDDTNDNKEYRAYNIMKCQYDDLPEKLPVIVKSIDPFGKIKLKQDEAWFNREHYEVGKRYIFEVIEIKEDFNTKTPYYVLEDVYATHRYYFKGEQKYQVGYPCILEITEIRQDGFLSFKEPVERNYTEQQETDSNTTASVEKHEDKAWKNLPVLELGDENTVLEFKTSIAFPPKGNCEADIDRQLNNILKVIVAFMNTKGGILYIGVHDTTRKIVGIEDDYSHLNDGEDDFNGQYKQNHDGYELKIRNTLDRLSQSVANSLIEINFESVDGHEYCKITVRPARRPIFLNGTELYVRQGNRTKLLKRDEITFHITERMTVSLKDIIDTDDINMSTGMLDINSLKPLIYELLNERKAVPTNIPNPMALDEVDYWITWYNDARWIRTRDKQVAANIHIQVPVYKNMSNPLVVWCYESAKVNVMKLSDFRKNRSLNVINENGWSKVEKPKDIFIMHPTDYLVGYSVDANGIESVKLHSISDYRPTTSATNQGAPFLPDTSRIEVYATIGAEHKNKLAHLIVPKSKRSSDIGTPLNTVAVELKDEIDYLNKILTSR